LKEKYPKILTFYDEFEDEDEEHEIEIDLEILSRLDFDHPFY
jgi:hypothetical protein